MKLSLNFFRFYLIMVLSFVSCQNFYGQCNISVSPSINNNICVGSSLRLIIQADSGSTFQWSPNTDLSNTNNDTVLVTPTTAGSVNYLVVATDTTGCINSLNVLVTSNAPTTSSITANSCNSYTLNGQTFTTSGSYTQNLTNAAGCDSTLTLNLTINSSSTGLDIQTACNSYTWIDGSTYTSSNNTATHTLTNSVGCDSVVNLDLTINYDNTGIDTQVACNSYTWIDGNFYTSSNTTATHTLSNVFGCDSVVTLDLTVNYSNTGVDVQTECDNYVWIDGNTYTSSNNTATHTLTNVAGCDSVVTLNLTILNSSSGTDIQTHCNSFTWIDGNTYTSSNNTATHTLTNSVGCDSVVTLNLTINYDNTGIDTHVACNSFTWIDGNTYTSNNTTATHTLTNIYGCDSVVTLDLTVNYSNTGVDFQTACDSFTWIDGNSYTSSNNTATHTLSNIYGCDSVVTLNLTVIYSTTSSLTATNCDSYTLNGQTYTTSGVYTQNLTNAVGCDSTLTLNLTINYSNSSNTQLTVCDSLVWNGQTYTTSGNYSFLTTNIYGCDSTANLNLTVHYLDTAYINLTACDGYILNGQTYTTSGTYIQNLNTVNGCDSTIILSLIVNYSTTSSLTDTACDLYVLNGSSYSSSGTYTQTLINSVGCDSILTLSLTVNNSNSSLNPLTVCDSSTWNGTTYSTSGVYSYLSANQVGCDSTAYLNLTVNYSTFSNNNALECINYLWNGTLYDSNGTYTYLTTNSVGCDSTATLNLTIYEPFLPGSISGQDTICKYSSPDSLFINLLPTGGDSSYNYQWINSIDGMNWSTINGANSITYQPGILLENQYYSLVVNNLCGVDTTNVIFDSILPSPTIIDIQGDSVFCANQHDNFFWINQTLPNISYDWQITGGSIFQQISDSALAVDMDPIPGDVYIDLTMIHNQTNCEVQVSKTVTTTLNYSPDRTNIIRKPNSSILVCDDSSENLIYQWGWTEKSSGIDTEIPGADLRYVLLPHSFDSTIYRYWVKTSYDYGNDDFCQTYSYLGPSPITNVDFEHVESNILPYPNPTNGIFYIPIIAINNVIITDYLGRSVSVDVFQNSNQSMINISSFSNGIYNLSIISNGILFSTVIIKQ